MRAKRAAQRTFYIVAFVVLLPTILFGLISYFHWLERRDYVTKRNLRFLAAEGTQLKLRVDNYVNNVLVHAAVKAADSQQWFTEEAELCRTQPPPQVPNKLPASESGRSESTTSLTEEEIRGRLNCAFRPIPSLKLVGAHVTSGSSSTTEITLTPMQKQETFQLAFDYIGPVAKHDSTLKFRAVTRMEDLVGGISRGVFDDVLIVRREGNDNAVIFQRTTSGPRLMKLGMVTSERGKEVSFTEVMFSSDVFRVNLADTQYKLFVQPVKLSLSTGSFEKGPKINVDPAWSLCGLVRADRFRSEGLAIPITTLLLFLFGFVLVLGSWPLVKLWSLGPTDRLRHADVFFVSVSVLMVSGLLTFFLVDFYAYRLLGQQLDVKLKEFSDCVADNFEQELGKLCQRLGQMKSEVCDDKPHVKTSILCNRQDAKKRSCDRPGWLAEDAPYFELISLVQTRDERDTKDGQQIRKWTIDLTSTPMINVSERAYFRTIKEGRGWTKEFVSGKFAFFLEPVLSLNTGQMQAVLSMPGPDSGECARSVATMIAKLISLRQAVVPPGFGYAVFDETGKVIFHSDLRRTLTENFVEECDNDRELRAHIYTRASDWINAPYTGRDHRLYVNPLMDLPWTLVVFRDKEIARTANLEMLSASLIIYIFYGIAFLLPVVLLCLRHPGWMWPNEGRITDYRHLLAANLALIALSLTEFFFVHHHHVPSVAFVLPPFALLLNCLKLTDGAHPSEWRQYPSFLLLVVLPILQLALGIRDSVEAKRGVLIYGALFQFLFLYVLFVLVFWPRRFFFPKIMEFLDRRRKTKLNFSVVYVLVGVSLVAILGVLPALVFFRSAHNSEMEILVKHGQLNLSRSLVERDERVNDEYRQVRMPAGYLEKRLLVKDKDLDEDDIYAKFFFDTDLSNPQMPAANQPGPGEHLFDKAMEAVRPLYNEYAIQTRELVHDAPADSSFQWDSSKDGFVQLVKGPPLARDYLPMTSKVPEFRWPSAGESWWLGLAAIALLFFVGVYLLVRFVTRKLFLLDLSAPTIVGTKVTDLGEVTENTLVLGMPHSGKSELLARGKFHLVDIRVVAAAGTWVDALNEEVPKGTKAIAIDHFDYDMDDPECNGQKLRLLEKFLFASRLIVVASSTDPMEFSIGPPPTEGRKGGKGGQDEKAQEEGRNRLASQYMDRWAAVCSMFTRRVYAAKEAKNVVQENELKAAISSAGFSSAKAAELFRECRPTERLRRFGMDILELHRGGELTDEQLIVEVLERALAYYRTLWATCSREEKLLLIDLAEDGFANAEGLVLRRLLERGLVVRGPHLWLMNESFRRFVLETGHAEEATLLADGTFSPRAAIRATFVASMIGAALILFVTQPQLLNLSTTFIGAVSAGIPALLELFDLMRGARTRG